MSLASGRSTSPMNRSVKCSCSSPTQRSAGLSSIASISRSRIVLRRADGDEQAVHCFFSLRRTRGSAVRFRLKVPLVIHDISAVSERALCPRKGERNAEPFDPRTTTGVNPAVSVGVPRAARDAGLRSYMLSVYNYMASGVLLTGIVALLFATTAWRAQSLRTARPAAAGLDHRFRPAGHRLGHELRHQPDVDRHAAGAVLGLCGRDGRVDVDHLPGLYRRSIAQTFFAVRPRFLGLSLYGYTTKRDLSGFGTFLIMGVVGLFVAMLINMFLQSAAMSWRSAPSACCCSPASPPTTRRRSRASTPTSPAPT